MLTVIDFDAYIMVHFPSLVPAALVMGYGPTTNDDHNKLMGSSPA